MEEVDESIKWIALFMHINIYARPDARHLLIGDSNGNGKEEARFSIPSINKCE